MIYLVGGGLVIFIWVWAFITYVITRRKRRHLTDHLIRSGGYVFANVEFNLVDIKTHYWRVFFLKNSKSLYGPFLQGVWKHTSNNINTYDEWWWRCYREIYLNLSNGGNTDKKIRACMARGNSLPAALTLAGINLEEWLLGEDQVAPPPKFAMTGAAEEYDQIMQMQEMLDGS